MKKNSFITLRELMECNQLYQLNIDYGHLEIVSQILHDNIPALINTHYHDVLYNCIEKKTSKDTCLKIKYLIEDHHFNESLNN